ncbi:dehydrogenase [Sulfodiicoccus acidiphilus]|uniref:Dehydrogenase n=1 Tax=Sulfodiicoccus acidiphilus TaxID=1670455 RepID=A0A348B1K0_9CREN|nr:xanthine dehydrogenase family protein molybdopterin-binding subunit [Sulfodiicoccus acidiphilus]BBD72052.1 dehydrogenase [Sulfodiicoccus acidiphilus]GGU00135.1 dehydrogenase [Sulfodiicoccus acidiphilus]
MSSGDTIRGRYIGEKIPRFVDGPEKTSGRAKYLIDVELPGMLYAAIARSPIPHGKIRRIDYEKIQRLDSVKAVVDGRESKLGNIGILRDNPPLKFPKVRSVCDEVVAIASTDEDKAKKYVQEVDMEMEELPPVFDPKEALKPGAPLVHEENGSNIVKLNFNVRAGNVEEALRKSHLVRKDAFSVPRVAFAPMGTLGALAFLDERNNLTLISNTQEPYQLKAELSKILGLTMDRVKIVQPYIGGNFGRGMDVYPFEVIVSLLALKTKRPVKLVYSRTEDFMCSPTRQGAEIEVTSGVDRNGRLTARRVEVLLDSGAYVSWGVFDARVMASTTTGLYAVPNVEFVATAVYTNNPYTINMRGAGNPQVTFAIESHMDMLAEELEMDRLDFRLLNAYEGQYVTPQGMRVDNARLRTVLSRVGELARWRTRERRSGRFRRGMGIAALFHVGGGARVYRTDGCGAAVKVDDGGKVTVFTGMTEMGQGSANGIAQIVASVLDLPLEKVEVIYKDDADMRPWDTATHASRATFVCGRAAFEAAKRLRERMIVETASLFNVTPSEVTLSGGKVEIVGKSTEELDLGKVVRRLHFQRGRLLYEYFYYDPPTEMANEENKGNISAGYAQAAQIAEVEVDTLTGEVKVLKVFSVHNVGRVINPLAAEGQVIGGIVQGLGHALFEELELKEGRVINVGFGDYEVPSATEAPDVVVEFVDSENAEGPFGAMGIAENGIIPIAAAIGNAIYDAVGVRLYKMPFRAEDVLVAIEKK